MKKVYDILKRYNISETLDINALREIHNSCYPLAYMPDTELKHRLLDIGKNIQFLNGSKIWNDVNRIECGWKSPGWWIRAYQLTLWEIERRKIPGVSMQKIATQDRYHYEYARKKRPTAVRISRIEWLTDVLDGRIRFGAASSYINSELKDAQIDDEMSRDIFLPPSLFTISNERGETVSLTEPVKFSASHTSAVFGRTNIAQYWLLCFSTELDSRLLFEFSGDQPHNYGYFILFDVEKFHRRLSEAISPFKIVCGRVEVDYYDERLSLPNLTTVIGNKPFRFAYQRELRFFAHPQEEKKVFQLSQLDLRCQNMRDIAGLYNLRGEKEAGFGPNRVFSKR